MPRNASGTMSNPNTPPVTHTAITVARETSWESDVVTEMTDSLSRSGKGAMLAALKIVDGTVAAPGVAFASESGSGLYRAAAGDLRLAILGADAVRVTAMAVSLASPTSLAATGTNAGLTIVGNKAAADAGTDVIVNSTATRTNGSVFAVQNNGAGLLSLAPAGQVVLAGTGPTIQVSGANTSLTVYGNRGGADAGVDVIATSLVARSAGSIFAVQNSGANKLLVDFNGEPSMQGGFACGQVFKTDADQVEGLGTNTAVTNMAFPVVANGIYVWEVVGIVNQSGSANVAGNFSGPAAPVAVSYGSPGAGCVDTNVWSVDGNLTSLGAAGSTAILWVGRLVNGVNAGTVSMLFHKIVGGTGSATFRQGALLRWRRIA